MTSTPNLITSECDSAAQVNDLFINNGLIVLKHTKRCCLSMSFTIPSGCYALVTRSGADLDYMDEYGRKHAVWPAGLHFPYFSSTGVSFFVTKRSTIFDIPVTRCITKDNISIDVVMALTFRIMGDPDLGEDSNLVRKFVYELTPSGLQHQLQYASETVIRAIIRLVNHSKVHGIRNIRFDLSNPVHVQGSRLNSITKKGIRPIISSSHSLDDNIKIEDRSTSSKSSDMESSMQMDSSLLVSSSEDSNYDDPAFNKMTTAQVVAAVLNEEFNVLGVEIQSVIIKNIVRLNDSQLDVGEKVLLKDERLIHDDVRNSEMRDQVPTVNRNIFEKVECEERNIEKAMNLQISEMEEELLLVRQKILKEKYYEHQVGREKRNAEDAKLKDEIAKGNKLEPLTRQETKNRIDNIIAQNDYEIQRVKDMTAAATAVTETKTKNLTVQQLADAKLEHDSYLADSKIRSLVNEVEAKKLLADTEGKMALGSKKEKDFITQLKRIEVYKKLATNESLIWGDSMDDDTNYFAAADSILGDKDDEGDRNAKPGESSSSSIVTEIGIYERLSRSYKDDIDAMSPANPVEELDTCFSKF